MNPGHLEDENRLLAERLEKLTKLSKKIIKPKKDFYLDPVKKKHIVKQKDNYEEVESKLDYDNIGKYQMRKQQKLKQKKKEKELASCTFKPKLNKRSKKMVKNVNYVRPHDKKLLRKKEEKKEEEEMEATTFNDIMKQLNIEGEEIPSERSTKTPKKKIKKINSNFYDKQLKWLNRKKQIAEKQRHENAKKEYSEVKAIPKTNKRKNEKLLGNRKKFIDRVDDETLKYKMKKTKLKEKYNKETFQPKINRNYKVQSKVKQTLGRNEVKQRQKRNNGSKKNGRHARKQEEFDNGFEVEQEEQYEMQEYSDYEEQYEN